MANYIGGEPATRTEWIKQDAYKPNTEWNGKTFYRVMGGKWVKQDAVVSDAEALPYPDNCLTFSSADSFSIMVNQGEGNWNGTIYYSTDTVTWSEWGRSATINSAEHNGEQRLYMRGRGNSVITGKQISSWIFYANDISCYGNIENLLDYEVVANGEHPMMDERCFYNMFNNCIDLVNAPELPATTLAPHCYAGMFQSCKNLVNAPKLPATTLAESCYASMFAYCSNLEIAPALPATNMVRECYSQMFTYCDSLASIPTLPATTLADWCYSSMFSECPSIKLSTTQTDEYHTPYRIPTSGTGTTASSYALSSMFTGTGGTFTGTPSINKTYYTSNKVV